MAKKIISAEKMLEIIKKHNANTHLNIGDCAVIEPSEAPAYIARLYRKESQNKIERQIVKIMKEMGYKI